MWQRTKRLINSYLDDLIERAGSPDKEAREITRAEIARLNELEVQTRASVKVLEKELAEVELRMIGVTERERIAREKGDPSAASAAGAQLVSLGAQRDLIRQQLAEAASASERARVLREERKRQGEDLANDTHLTSMRENLSSVQRPFDSMDPAGTIDEMRARIQRSSASLTDNRVAEADRELEKERARASVEEMLSRYKQGIGTNDPVTSPSQTTSSQAPRAPSGSNKPATQVDDDAPAQSKTLGRTDGPIRPID